MESKRIAVTVPARQAKREGRKIASVGEKSRFLTAIRKGRGWVREGGEIRCRPKRTADSSSLALLGMTTLGRGAARAKASGLPPNCGGRPELQGSSERGTEGVVDGTQPKDEGWGTRLGGGRVGHPHSMESERIAVTVPARQAMKREGRKIGSVGGKSRFLTAVRKHRDRVRDDGGRRRRESLRSRPESRPRPKLQSEEPTA